MPREQMEFPLINLPRLTHFGHSDQIENYNFGPHKHYGYELIYVAGGEAEARMFEGASPLPLKRDDLWVIPPEEVHQFQYDHGHIDFYWLGFQTGENVVLAENHMTDPYHLLARENKYPAGRVQLIRQMDEEILSISRRIRVQEHSLFRKVPLFNRLFQSIEFELHHTDDFSEMIIYQKLIEIFAFIARLSRTGGQVADSPLDYAYRYLKHHNREKVDFRELAVKTGYSREHFSRAFKLKFGASPRAFHEECRIAEARDFLAKGLSVQDTAFSCGFVSSSHFSTWFRKRQGQSPEQYYSN